MTGGVEAGVLGVAAEVIINEGAGLGEVERAVMAVRAYSKDGDGCVCHWTRICLP